MRKRIEEFVLGLEGCTDIHGLASLMMGINGTGFLFS